MFRAPSAHHQEVKVKVLYRPVHDTATYRSDDTRGCVMQFFELLMMSTLCSKHVGGHEKKKLTVKQKFCASSWLITETHGQQNFK